METVLMTVAGAIIGWLIPEGVLYLSPQSDKFKEVPVSINVLSVIAFGIIFFCMNN